MNQYPYPVGGTAVSYQQPIVYTPAQPAQAILDPAYSPYGAQPANYLNPNPMYPATSYAHSGSHYGGATTRYPYNGTATSGATVVTVPSSSSGYHRSRRSSSRHRHHHHDRPHSRSSHRSHHRHGSSSHGHGHKHSHSHSGHGGHHHSSRHHQHGYTTVQYRPLTFGEKVKRFFGFGRHASRDRSGGGFLTSQKSKNAVYVDTYGRQVDKKGRPLYAV